MPKSQLVFDEGDVADTVKDQFLDYELSRALSGEPGRITWTTDCVWAPRS